MRSLKIRGREAVMVLFALAMTAAMMFGIAMTVQAADPVTYIERRWDGSKVTETRKTVSDYIRVTTDTATFDKGKWYVVSENVSISDRILMDHNGTANLILCDGAALTAAKGIMVRNDAILNIYVQERGTGTLVANGTGESAGIGGGRGTLGRLGTGGTINIHGGRITAAGGAQGAGIGGGGYNTGCGPVTIFAGTVTATGGNTGGNVGASAGIGGGPGGPGHNGGGSKIRIYGGKVTANGGVGQNGSGAGIGGGSGGAGGDVYIYGGEVNANGGSYEGAVGARSIGGGAGAAASNNGSLTLGPNIRVYGDDRLNPPATVRYHATDIESKYTGTRFLHLKVIWLEPVTYLEWDDTSKRLVEKTALDYALVDSNTRELKNDWYLAKGEFTNNNRITVTGRAHVIFYNGASMNANPGGIRVNEGNSLSLYTQSTDKNTMGYIVAGGPGNAAAIGGDSGSNAGEIIIHGANLLVTGLDDGGAGIGGGRGGSGGTVIIYSGDITSIGGASGGAGIGGGNGGSGGRIEIYGGKFDVGGNGGGAGIGGGRGGDGGRIGIYGGEVWAAGGVADNDANHYGMGIGRGYGGTSDGVLEVGPDLYVYGGERPQPTTNILPDDGEYARQHYMIVYNKVPPHDRHIFSYSANGPVITATCIGPGKCPQHYDEGIKLTISAQGGAYDGETSYGATLEGRADFNSITGQSVSEDQIEYYEGSDRLDGAPVNAGTYIARITVQGKTASADFTVTPLDSVVTTPPMANTLIYTGEAQALVSPGEASGGTMQYALGNADEATEEYSESIPAGTDAGTYYIWYKVKGNANYKDTEPVCITVTMKADKYMVTFVDEDGSILKEATEYPTGTPAADIRVPDNPTKAADAHYTYEFAGWDPEITDVTADAVYKAVYTANAIPDPTPTPEPDPTPTPKPDPTPTPTPAPAPGSDPNQKGTDGTAVGPGASAAAAEKAIISLKSDSDPKGALYLPLKLKSSKQKKTSITISWTKAKGASKYVIYGNRCGRTNKMKKLVTVKGKSRTFKKIAGKKVKKGTSYKFIVVALNKKNNVVATSKMIHAFTKGGRQTNHKAVKLQLKSGRKFKTAKKATVKAGKTVKIRGVGINAVKKLKYKAHVQMRYESSSKKIATVTAKGVIKGRKKGTCYVWAYSQNGIGKSIKVVVK